MWSKKLAKLQYFDPTLLVGRNDEENRVCAFLIALTLFSNDSKVLLGLVLKMDDLKPGCDCICEDVGEYAGQRIYLYRLVYAQLHELHYLFIQHYPRVSNTAFSKSIYRQMSQTARVNWDSLVTMATDKNNEMKAWLKDVRDGLGFHYVRHEELLNGYKTWLAGLGPGGKYWPQEGAYVSPGLSIQERRYYFADGAADSWITAEIAKLAPENRSLEGLMERNVRAITGFFNAFLKVRGANLKFSKYPKFPKKGGRGEPAST